MPAVGREGGVGEGENQGEAWVGEGEVHGEACLSLIANKLTTQTCGVSVVGLLFCSPRGSKKEEKKKKRRRTTYQRNCARPRCFQTSAFWT